MNNNGNAEGGRPPSLNSNVGTCHSTKKGAPPPPPFAADNNSLQTANEQPNNCTAAATKKVEEPWRNYGKSYARHNARNPAD